MCKVSSQSGGEVKQKTSINIEAIISGLTGKPDSNEKVFTHVDKYHGDKNPKPNNGIFSYMSLNELTQFINELPKDLKKNKSKSILKGIFEGGTSGIYNKKPVPFLFFDIDVSNEKKENVQLLDSYKNSEVFDYMEKISVLTFRSFSGYGIAGILYVPQLSEIGHDKKETHNSIGNSITSKISIEIKKTLGIDVKFDSAQNKFRQLRYLARQKQKIKLNPDPNIIEYIVSEKLEFTSKNTPLYFHGYTRVPKGSIEQSYNSTTPISIELERQGALMVSENRYKFSITSSQSTGAIDQINNVFYNHSTSFSQIKAFTPFRLKMYCEDKTATQLNLELKDYFTAPKFELSRAIMDIGKATNTSQLSDICLDYTIISTEDKYSIIDNSSIREPLQKYMMYPYLEVSDVTIQYDYNYTVSSYVSERIQEISQLSSEYNKLCIRAETGTGKTTAFIKELTKIRPEARIALVFPLVSIVDQLEASYPDIVCLSSKSLPEAHSRAKMAKIVIATYDQFVKYSSSNYDFIIIDEFHNMSSSILYRSKTIRSLTRIIDNSNAKIIGLTGTPNLLIPVLGFKLVNITVINQEPVKVIQRLTNLEPHTIIMNHHKSVKGKAIYRCNNIDTLNIIAEELKSIYGYNDEQVVVFTSSNKTKKSIEYEQLICQEHFTEELLVLLTTSLIDEGVNIKQKGFTDIVFIDNNKSPAPEPIKQFFARFRDHDNNRKNFVYRGYKKEQTSIYQDPTREFMDTLTLLESNIYTSQETYNHIFSISNYFDSYGINQYYLAHRISQNYYGKLTVGEFNRLCAMNYNLVLEEDTEFVMEEVDKTLKKLTTKELNDTLYDIWINNFDMLKYVIHTTTQDQTLKSSIEHYPVDVAQDIADFIIFHRKKLESLLSAYYIIESLGFEPNEYIVHRKRLYSPNKVHKSIRILNTLKLIKNPVTEEDHSSKARVENFIKKMMELNSFTSTDIKREQRKVHEIGDVSVEDMLILLRFFGEIKKHGKTQRFVWGEKNHLFFYI